MDNSEDYLNADWVTVEEISNYYRISTSTVRRFLKKHSDINFFLINQTLRVNRQSFDEVMQQYMRNKVK